ncbi:hypothetical protein C0992_000788 [Termitomyces sp. T32_za158]|nr:hypothetical protein C0992_000788 [Termitomyces sp. T32_za158]
MPRRSTRLASSAAARTCPAAELESLNNDTTVEISPTGPSDEGSVRLRPQKRRKQTKPNASTLHPSSQVKNVRGRRGALKDIVEMPLDILLEIFMYLTPVEILSLSRACKSLRRTLMTKTAEYVWKQARLNLDDFPDCPDDLAEPQFANLIFAALCDYCNKAKGRYFIWSIRRCYCGLCITSQKGLIWPSDLPDSRQVYTKYPDFRLVLPSIDPQTKTESVVVDQDHLICRKYAKRLLSDFRKSKTQAEWILEHTEERRRRIEHGRLCEKWLEKQADERAAQLDEIRKRRCEAIKQKLTVLGWGEDLKTITGMESWPSVKQPQDFTDRDDIIKNMQEHRAQRLKRQHLNAQSDRIGSLGLHLSGVRQKHWGQTIFPDITDLSATEPIATLIKAPTEETIEFPESVILDATRNWRASCDAVLRNLVPASTTRTSGATATGVNPLVLATTFFSCSQQTYACEELQYPEVLKHKCANSYASDCGFPGDKLAFCDKSYSAAKGILEAAGVNPDTTTREDVQWPAFIVECHQCPKWASVRGGRLLMSWPLAVRHAKRHADEPLPMSRANLTGAELRRVHSLAAGHFKDCYKCAICGDFYSSQNSSRDHIRQTHKEALQCSTECSLGISMFGFGPQPDGEIFLRPGYA